MSTIILPPKSLTPFTAGQVVGLIDGKGAGQKRRLTRLIFNDDDTVLDEEGFRYARETGRCLSDTEGEYRAIHTNGYMDLRVPK